MFFYRLFYCLVCSINDIESQVLFNKLNNDQIDERNIWNNDYFLHFCFVFGKDKKSMNKNVLVAIKAL
jgi:hypothetical protein